MARKKGKECVGINYDWIALKAEFMQSSETPNKFRIRKGIRADWFYGKAKGWLEERNQMHRRAYERAMDQTETKLAKHWVEYSKLWGAVRGQAAKILSRTIDETGKIVRPLDPLELRSLASAIETALKGDKLIYGEPTEITKDKTENVHVQVVQVLQAIKKGEIQGE